MKDSNRSKNGWKNLQDKGYYIVLTLCIIAVGISGYIFVSTAIRQNNATPDELSVPVTADKLPSSPSAAPAAGTEELTPPSSPTQAETDELLRQEARKLAVPPLKGEVIQTFSADSLSYNETTRDWRLHDAVDLKSDGGEVFACMAGTVTEVYDDVSYGTTVVITHDGGYETRYSNLTAMPVVSVGDLVDPGDLIGAVGATAMLESAAPGHLHFQVLLNGESIDPMEFLE